jgi:Methyltransferase domain
MDPAGAYYLRFHRRRYQALLNEVAGVLPAYGKSPLILDVGMSYQTIILGNCFPDSSIRTVGFYDGRFEGRLPREHHTEFDLNDVRFPERIPVGIAEHEVVIMAEVIEHLYSPAKQVLECIKRWLKPSGTLILQTPNPVSLGKRVALLRGVTPFEMIREARTNPGHFCEFTVRDICAAVESAGLTVTSVRTQNYFGRRSITYDALCAMLPGSLHDGIMICARK